MDNLTPEVQAKPPDRDRRNLILLGVSGGLLAIVLFLVAAVIIFNPFGIMDRLFGGTEPLAGLMPQDMQLYVSLDLAHLESDEMNDVFQVIGASVGEDFIESADLIRTVDEELRSSYGFTFTEDVKPWIGRSVALGIAGVEYDFYGMEESMSWILAAEVRDKDAADAFLADLADLMETSRGAVIVGRSYDGMTMYVANIPGNAEGWVFGRFESALLFSSSSSLIENAIGQDPGNSLAQVSAFRTVMAKLPRGRAISMFIDLAAMQNMPFALAGIPGMAVDASALEYLEGFALSVSATGAGLQMDMVASSDPDLIPEQQISFSPSRMGRSRTADMFPEGTILFLRAVGLDEALSRALGQGDAEEALDLLELQLGIDLHGDLLAHLDGEFGIGILEVTEASGGLDQLIPIGILGIAETSDAVALEAGVENIVEALSRMGLYQLTETRVESVNLYRVADALGDPVVTLGVTEEHFLVGWGEGIIENALESRSPLSRSGFYREMSNALPGGMDLFFCLDMPALTGLLQRTSGIPGPDSLIWVRGLVMGIEPVKNAVQHTVIVLVIDIE
ncbi:MAG: DUF3352 domain-containing protein [Anaerolineales bacterium]|jgi:hypothetical protein